MKDPADNRGLPMRLLRRTYRGLRWRNVLSLPAFRRPLLIVWRSRGRPRCINIGDVNQNFFKWGWETLNVLARADHYANLKTDVLPFPNESIDLMYCSHVLEHLRDEELSRLLGEFFRTLKPRGVLRIAVPDLEKYVRSFHEDRLALHFDRFVTPKLTMRQSLEREVAAGLQPPEVLEIHNGLISVVASYTNGHPLPVADEKSVRDELEKSTDSFVAWCVALKSDEGEDFGHFNAFDFTRLARFLREAGFTEIRRSSFSDGAGPRAFQGLDRTVYSSLSLYIEASPQGRETSL